METDFPVRTDVPGPLKADFPGEMDIPMERGLQIDPENVSWRLSTEWDL